jgi:hypothetical protein
MVDFGYFHPLEGLLRLLVRNGLNLVQRFLDALLGTGDGDGVAVIVWFGNGDLGGSDLFQFLKFSSSFS